MLNLSSQVDFIISFAHSTLCARELIDIFLRIDRRGRGEKECFDLALAHETVEIPSRRELVTRLQPRCYCFVETNWGIRKWQPVSVCRRETEWPDRNRKGLGSSIVHQPFSEAEGFDSGRDGGRNGMDGQLLRQRLWGSAACDRPAVANPFFLK
jgi:hypothetical protein